MMNSSFLHTADATPPIINQGLSTDWPPLTLEPASLQRSTQSKCINIINHFSCLPLNPCITWGVTTARSCCVISLLTPIDHIDFLVQIT